MKILHTADWHLGAKIEGKDRLAEQEKILNEIAQIADDYDVSGVIIAGDVFHNKMPSGEAEDLFFKAVEKLSDNGNRLVFVLSGNHDDSLRLGASEPLALRHNIILATDLDAVDIRRTRTDVRSRIVDAGRGFIKFKRGEEQTTIAFLPFMGANQTKELAGLDDYKESVKKISNELASNFSSDSFNLFVGHLFLAGGKLNDGQTISVGEALSVSPVDLPEKAHYIALGHLHSAKKLGQNCYYSGATIELRVKDKRPQVNIIDGDKNGVNNVFGVTLTSTIDVKEITASNIAFAYKKISEEAANDYVYLTISEPTALKASDLRDLKQTYPNIVNVKITPMINLNEETLTSVDFKNLSDRELFVKFYFETTGREPTDELVNLFLECRGEQDASN